jgi:glycosyl transferase family 22 (putative mannosyltransferase)
MYRVSESLLWQHSLRISDPFLHINEPYAIYGLAVPVMILPLVAAGHLIFDDGTRLLSIYQPAVTSATVVVVALIAREIGCGWRTTTGIALLYGFATVAWFYSNVLFSEPLVALATALAFYSLLRIKRKPSLRWLAITGGAVALACLARTDSLALTSLPVSIYLMAKVILPAVRWSERLRRTCAYLVPVAGAGLVVLAHDWIRYGSPLTTGYGLPGMGFTFPFLRGIYGLLLSPAAGLFVFMPVMILAVVGFPRFLRSHRAEALLIAGLVGARLIFYASWWAWDGGDSWGPRFLVPVLPLLVLPVVFIPRWVRPRLTVPALTGLSLTIQVLGQLVSYYSFSIWTIATLPPGLSPPACTTCGARSAVALQAGKDVIDFDWANAPLLDQIRILMRYGPVHRGWSLPLVALALVLLVGAGVWLGWRLLKVIESQTASRPPRTGVVTGVA